MVVFIQVIADPSVRDAGTVTNEDGSGKLVRSQAMKYFRQSQRKERLSNASHEAWKKHRTAVRRRASENQKPETGEEGPCYGREEGTELVDSCILDIFQATHVYRMALTSNFVEGNFSASNHSGRALAGILSHWTSPQSPAMEAGGDALSLLHFGSAIGDKRIVVEGHRRYLRTLLLVRQDIQGIHEGTNLVGMLAACQDLLGCEIYKVASSGFAGWERHIAGINAIVDSHKFGSIDSMFAAFLSAQFRHFSLMYALVKRSPKALRPWCWLLQFGPGAPGSLQQLMTVALDLPALLEDTDRLCTRSNEQGPGESVRPILQRLQSVEAGLTSWAEVLRSQHGGSLQDEKLCDLLLTLGLQTSRWYPLATVLQRLLLLLVLESQWSLRALISQDTTFSRTAADRCAEDLMQGLEVLILKIDGEVAKACAVRAPLYFVSEWYRRSMNGRKLGKCEDLDARLQERFAFLDWGALLPLSFLPLLWMSLS